MKSVACGVCDGRRESRSSSGVKQPGKQAAKKSISLSPSLSLTTPSSPGDQDGLEMVGIPMMTCVAYGVILCIMSRGDSHCTHAHAPAHLVACTPYSDLPMYYAMPYYAILQRYDGGRRRRDSGSVLPVGGDALLPVPTPTRLARHYHPPAYATPLCRALFQHHTHPPARDFFAPCTRGRILVYQRG